MEYDFSGYATKNNLRCSDGRVIKRDAFKDNDGSTVPLVWQHMHNDPENVLGHALLQNRDDGVYAYCKLNQTTAGRNAQELVKHGDIVSLSIYANKLVQNGSDVLHGAIREVSLVLAGANPGALIDNLNFAHADGSVEECEDEAIIYTGENLELSHADAEEEATEEETDMPNPPENKSDKTIQDVIDTMNDEQKNVLYYLVGQAMEDDTEDVEEDVEVDEEEELAQSAFGMDDDMYHNVFEQNGNGRVDYATEMIHSEFADIVADAKRVGSFKDSLLMHAQNYGIESIDLLFPDAKSVNGGAPDFIKRRTEWVAAVLSGTRHTPFSRIKSTSADITKDEARAKGYIKGNRKVEEVFSVLKRTTDPTTVYKKQKLDRDDVLDITDFDVVMWLRGEMRLMLEEELARAILIGDGRDASSEDKIPEDHIRSIWKDDELYAPKLVVNSDETVEDMMDNILLAMDDYEGSGAPTLFTSQTNMTQMLLLKDKIGRRLYSTEEELAKALGVSKVVPVPVFKDQTRTTSIEGADHTMRLFGIIVNLKDYTVGSDKGGEINTFDDFDIDYNQQKYLIETRCSGALTLPKSAIVVEVDEGSASTGRSYASASEL
ncbi:MAG: major capsid protein [Chaetfec virus UA24_144]|nr:MAG: major capsid protein [Chaetfec virus UA24_144]